MRIFNVRLEGGSTGIELSQSPYAVLRGIQVPRRQPLSTSTSPPHCTLLHYHHLNHSHLHTSTPPPPSTLLLRGIQVLNVRGPFPRGQCVQLSHSSHAILEHFSCVNDVLKCASHRIMPAHSARHHDTPSALPGSSSTPVHAIIASS